MKTIIVEGRERRLQNIYGEFYYDPISDQAYDLDLKPFDMKEQSRRHFYELGQRLAKEHNDAFMKALFGK